MPRPFRAVVPLACLLVVGACDKIPLPKRSDGRATLESLPPVPAPAAPARARPRTAAVKGNPSLDADRFDRMRRDLRRLVSAEETFFAENGTYTDDFSRIGFQPEGEHAVRFLWAGRGGWAARATHDGVPGRDCVIYVGRERPAPGTVKDGRIAKEGVPVCDRLATAAAPVAARPPTPAAAAPPATPGAQPEAAADTSSALDAVSPSVQMRVDLRNLIRSQETYFATQGRYSKRTEPFALQYLWHRGVTVRLLSATDNSWSARATHVARPGKSCVIWFGPVAQRPATEMQHKTPEQPSTPVCDD